MSVDVSSDYLSTLGSTSAFDDGALSGDELAADPEAAALVAALQDQIAAQLGVDPDQVTITVSYTTYLSCRRL
jgi:hypothetical protein